MAVKLDSSNTAVLRDFPTAAENAVDNLVVNRLAVLLLLELDDRDSMLLIVFLVGFAGVTESSPLFLATFCCSWSERWCRI